MSDSQIKVLIAEDEQPIRQLLESYLSLFPGVEIAGRADNGREVLALIDQARPLAVFLDIEMPDLDGLTTAAKIKERHPDIFIVFVTAYARYAAEAFQLDAVDYLIKPFTRDSVSKAMAKIERLLALKTSAMAGGRPEARLVIKNGHEIFFINHQDILFIEKELRKSIIHTENMRYSTNEPLNILEKKIGTDFFRCHKSFIINLNKIQKIAPIAERIYKVYFFNYSCQVTMTREKLEQLYKMVSRDYKIQ